MSSAVEICNVALIGLGGETISSLEENTSQANMCNTVWNQARRAVLRSHPWNFAMKTTQLPQLQMNDRSYKYDYGYQLPSDLMRLVQVNEDYDYKVESNTIFTKRDTCFIKYIFDNDDVASWDSLFSAVMSAKIQELIAYSITRERTDVENARKNYLAALFIAQATDSQEDIEDPFAPADNSFIDIRF